jgi:hypothetical protein
VLAADRSPAACWPDEFPAPFASDAILSASVAAATPRTPAGLHSKDQHDGQKVKPTAQAIHGHLVAQLPQSAGFNGDVMDKLSLFVCERHRLAAIQSLATLPSDNKDT